jgi:hypothetical protein
MDSFAEVALHLARVQGTFHYLVPPSLISGLGPGHLVVVPFDHSAQGRPAPFGESPVAETRPLNRWSTPCRC